MCVTPRQLQLYARAIETSAANTEAKNYKALKKFVCTLTEPSFGIVLKPEHWLWGGWWD